MHRTPGHPTLMPASLLTPFAAGGHNHFLGCCPAPWGLDARACSLSQGGDKSLSPSRLQEATARKCEVTQHPWLPTHPVGLLIHLQDPPQAWNCSRSRGRCVVFTDQAASVAHLFISVYCPPPLSHPHYNPMFVKVFPILVLVK